MYGLYMYIVKILYMDVVHIYYVCIEEVFRDFGNILPKY